MSLELDPQNSICRYDPTTFSGPIEKHFENSYKYSNAFPYKTHCYEDIEDNLYYILHGLDHSAEIEPCCNRKKTCWEGRFYIKTSLEFEAVTKIVKTLFKTIEFTPPENYQDSRYEIFLEPINTPSNNLICSYISTEVRVFKRNSLQHSLIEMPLKKDEEDNHEVITKFQKPNAFPYLESFDQSGSELEFQGMLSSYYESAQDVISSGPDLYTEVTEVASSLLESYYSSKDERSTEDSNSQTSFFEGLKDSIEEYTINSVRRLTNFSSASSNQASSEVINNEEEEDFNFENVSIIKSNSMRTWQKEIISRSLKTLDNVSLEGKYSVNFYEDDSFTLKLDPSLSYTVDDLKNLLMRKNSPFGSHSKCTYLRDVKEVSISLVKDSLNTFFIKLTPCEAENKSAPLCSYIEDEKNK